MYSDQQLKWRPIITVGSILAILVWLILLLIAGNSLADLLPSLLRFGVVSFSVYCGWIVFTRYAWRWKWLRWGGWLVSTPDMNGRWVGTSLSTYDRQERSSSLEIRQSLLRVQCTAFGPGNSATSYSARVLADPEERTFKLAYLYHASRKVMSCVPGDQHDGVAVLMLVEGKPRRLRGYYLNNRDPDPRKADMDLSWESSTLKNEL